MADTSSAAETGRLLAVVHVQLAALSAVVASIIEAAPEQERIVMLAKAQQAIETMHASLLAQSGPISEIELGALENFRRILLGDVT
ncbi:hypothetical protein [Rhizobacter sp. SG703]|uniref:hypothetical protein n=1 Tax=Rhizobacter sp. SG703 TaxID=2587140 RepID=UPI001445B58A|nr:hypothetical protein [Rhizobacter sp. SG703]NKI96622.1 hypothetical protein [Rhizobacter sp. SG703]